MIFDEKYFEAEEIEGFHVRSMMKRYWAAHIEVLLEFDRVCNELGIKYFADYGTLLGAVRHKGFIPWDDDMDISMLRGDYEILKEQADKHFRDGMMLYNKCRSAMGPMRVVNTIAPQISPDFLEKYHGCPYSAGIDIYPIDRLPKDDSEKEYFRVLHQSIKYVSQRNDTEYQSKVARDYWYKMDGGTDEEMFELIDKIEKELIIKVDREGNLAVQMAELLDKVQATYWNTDSNELVYLHGWARGKNKPLPIATYTELIRMPFMNIELPVPKEYDKVLRERFGDSYMTPIVSAGDHEYPGYKNSQKTLLKVFEQCGINPPELYLE